MRLVTVAALAGILLTAVPVHAATLSVDDVIARYHELTGKVVTIRGWMDSCEQLGCGLYASPREAQQSLWGKRTLSIGYAPEFDRLALGKGPAEIVLKARITGHCFYDPSDENSEICVDRADQIEPIKIMRLSPIDPGPPED